jgi:hypothetical protein
MIEILIFYINIKFHLLALPSLRYVVVIPFVPDHSMDLSAIPNRFFNHFF